MSEFLDVPLVQEWLSFSDSQNKTPELFTSFVNSQLTAENVDVPGSTATALYSGQIKGTPVFQIAQDLADRSDNQLRMLDNTNIGQFLDNIFKDIPEARETLGFAPNDDFINRRFEAASEKFALETKGPVITITPNAAEFRVDGSKVTYTAVEVENLLKSEASSVNGRSLDEIRAVVNQLGGPDSDEGRAYAKSQFDGDFARILAQGSDNSLQIGPYGGALDFDFDTQTKLGIGHLSFEPTGGAIVSPQSGLSDSLKASAARGLAAETIFLGNTNTPSKALSAVGLDFASETDEFGAVRNDIIQGIDKLEADDWRTVRSFDGFVEKVKKTDIRFFASWGKEVFEKLSTSGIDAFNNATSDVRGSSIRLGDVIKRFAVDENNSVRIPELSSFREITPDIAAKALSVDYNQFKIKEAV